MTSDLPDLPSVFAPVLTLREGGDAMARAVAEAPRHGAGTLAWARSLSRLEAAVVLEPELPLAAARAALFCAVGALAVALAASGPPEVPVTLRWPARLLVNGGEVGVARLAWPPGCAEEAVPDWIVVGVEARLTFPRGWEPFDGLHRTALFDEGWSEAEAPAAVLAAAWALHLMAGLAEWQPPAPGGGAVPAGFRRLAERYLARLQPEDWMQGGRRGLDPATGDLLIDTPAGRRAHRLADALAEAA